MSYSCYMEVSNFRMNMENFEGALRKLIASDYADDVSRYRTHQTPGEMLAVCDKGAFGEIQELLEQFFHDNGYSVGYDGKSNIVSITHIKDHWFDDTDFFDVFAEFVEKGSYIEMSGGLGDRWRMYFDGENCQEINAVITFPGIEDEAKDEKAVHPRLLEAVEVHEDGRVFDNADDLFAYMFNEGYTFAEFVNKLTPEIKEAIVFGQEWNGGVVKDNGQYYYSPEFEGNFNADVKAPSFDKYAIAKEVEFENFKNTLECLGYSPEDYTEEKLREMFDDHYDKLGNDDVYNAIYNETLDEVVRSHEKVNSVDELIEGATDRVVEGTPGGAGKNGMVKD